MRIRQLDLTNFKAFSKFTLNMGSNAFLVGPNNAGKSTLVSATRASAGMLTHSMRRKPTGYRAHGSKRGKTHDLRADQYGLVTENLRHQFRGEESIIRMKTDTDLCLTAVWPSEAASPSSPFFYLEHQDGRAITEPKEVRQMAGLVGIIPSLYPLSQEERVLDNEYLLQQMEGRRSSRHTRNHLRQLQSEGQLQTFTEFALEWLPEIDTLEVSTRPGAQPGEHVVDVYIREAKDRTPKEMFWAGDGMQVFIQLLIHLWRLREADVIVLDEPDLYLHADLQRRLVRLLETTGAQTIAATHSSEMLAEASPDSVIWVDKSRRKGVRRPEPASLQDLSSQIGTSFNLRLAAALRASVILFVEGDDMSVVRTLAKTIGASSLAQERNCTVIELNGFTNWVHVESFQWFVSEFLDDSVATYVLLDRDYRPDEEATAIKEKLDSTGVQAHIWKRKELENYLLAPSAISRVSGADISIVLEMLSGVTSAMTDDVVSQLLAHRHNHQKSTGRDVATVISAGMSELNTKAIDLDWRLARYPGKEIVKALNRELQGSHFKTVSAKKLAQSLRVAEIPAEMSDWLQQVESAVTK